jgi:hypothetical protein
MALVHGNSGDGEQAGYLVGIDLLGPNHLHGGCRGDAGGSRQLDEFGGAGVT